MGKRAAVKFYGHTKPDGYLSNFFPAPIWIEGKRWPTTEHYFQAMKFHDKDHQEKIRTCGSPARSKKLGRTRAVKLREDWEQVKDTVMFKACMAKFTQNKQLQRKLLDTDDAKLIEHTTRDRVWGDGGDGTGENRLGKTLMKVRELLRRQAAGACSHHHDDDDDDDGNDAAPHQAADSDKQGSPTLKKAKAGTMLDFVTKDTPHKAAETSPVEYKTGDLLRATEQCIAHQCNAVSTYAKGLSKVIFSKYPQANMYKRHAAAKRHSTPGTIEVHAGKPHCIINMVAQHSPGRPRKAETAAQRLQWFQECLKKVAANKDIASVAFPHMIGCGLAGGEWDDYKAAIETFASKNPHVRVVVYRLPS